MPRNLPELRTGPVPRWQGERLEAWLRDWTFHEALKDPEDSDDVALPRFHLAGSDSGWRDLVAAFDSGESGFRPGCIRLLSANVLPNADRPVYLLVLSDWEAGSILVCPFGPFSQPGATGELRTRREETPLHVLSCWNALAIPPGLIEHSWSVGSFSEEELAEAWAVFRHVSTGADLPQALIERVGPPIVRSYDPRVAYQDQEAALMAPLAKRARAALEGSDSPARPEEGAFVVLPPPPPTRPGLRELATHALAARADGDDCPGIIFAGTWADFVVALGEGLAENEVERFTALWEDRPREDDLAAQWDVAGTPAEALEGRLFAVANASSREVLGVGEFADATAILTSPVSAAMLRNLDRMDQWVLIALNPR